MKPLPSTRITGVDLARALAMAGMVVVHYIWPDHSGSAVDTFASAMLGRAMPLFMLLGGVGVSLAVPRMANPDQALAIRAALLFGLGLVVEWFSVWVAVVLQFYGLLFAAAPLLRRLSTQALVVVGIIVAIAGSWTYQVMGTFPPETIEFTDLGSAGHVIGALFVDGYYPFFPVASFFIIGIVLGRLDLRSATVAKTLTLSGLGVGIGALIMSWIITNSFDIDTAPFQLAADTPNPGGFDVSRFSWSQWLDTVGHRQMLAWVVSAAGTATATLGLSLLLAPLSPTVIRPFVSLGRVALTFYVVQVALTNVVAPPSETGYGAEILTVLAMYFGFMFVAELWLRWFPAGPLEAALRYGSIGRRRALDRVPG